MAGGEEDRLAGKFYDPFLTDPLLRPLFRDPEEDHAGHMALFLIEVPAARGSTRGIISLISAHHPLQISDAQRDAWVEHMFATCAELEWPTSLIAVFEPFIRNDARIAQGMVRGDRWGQGGGFPTAGPFPPP